MSVYLYTSYDISDAETYAPYVPNVLPILTRYGGEIISADTAAITMDGEPKQINVILKFPSMAVGMQMMEDEEYLPWLQRRLSSTENRTSILMKEFDLADFQ